MKANESKGTKVLLLVMSMGLFLVVGYYKQYYAFFFFRLTKLIN